RARDLWQPYAGPHNSGESPTEYHLEFIAENVRYEYEVHVASWGVQYEALASYPKRFRRNLFTRTQNSYGSDISFDKGASLTGPTAEVLKITQVSNLFLGMAFRFGHKALTPVARALAANGGIDFITFRDRQDEQVLTRVLVEMLE